MKAIRRPLTPVDKMFQGPATPYTPGRAKKTPDAPAPPVAKPIVTEPKPPAGPK